MRGRVSAAPRAGSHYAKPQPRRPQDVLSKQNWPASQFCCRLRPWRSLVLLHSSIPTRSPRCSATCARSARRPCRSHPATPTSRSRAPALRQRSAAAAARCLRALRAGLHAAPVPRQCGLHARARRQPLHHRLPRSNFTWRESHFRDLIGLMGDGLLTIDGDFHRAHAWRCSRASTASGSPPRST